MPIVINEGATFMLTDERGDITPGGELGLYDRDRRMLSRSELRLDGEAPIVIGGRAVSAWTALHILTNPLLAGAPRGTLIVRRERTVGGGVGEELEVANFGDAEAAVSLELRFGADFAHIFEVKRAVEEKPAASSAAPEVRVEAGPDGRSLSIRDPRDARSRSLRIEVSETAAIEGTTLRFDLRLARRARWRLTVECHVPAPPERSAVTRPRRGPHPDILAHRGHRQHEMIEGAPRLETDSVVLREAYEQSVTDFARLCITGEEAAPGEYVIAAGIPWFMTLFGRDSLIAGFQALPFYPEHARGVLDALARLQGTKVDRIRQEEPGKILHEYRASVAGGDANVIPAFPYYGSVDATPLFLMLLAAVWRSTGDLAVVRSLREPALRALEWMDRYGDRDGDGYLEYRLDATVGLANQGWKDSHDSIRFRDGRLARPPIALCEVQGYAYAARAGMADVFAALGEEERARPLRATADKLRERINADFWLPDREFYALALDGDKRPVDALTSNPGHLLWTGVPDEARARQVAERLLPLLV